MFEELFKVLNENFNTPTLIWNEDTRKEMTRNLNQEI